MRIGRGPAWSNSLFEDNAEFGLGMRLAVDKQADYARELLKSHADWFGESLVAEILQANPSSEAEIAAQRERVGLIKQKLANLDSREARDLLAVADALVRKTIWIVGGDGWAYDIGAGGLDHVLGSGTNVNVLVLGYRGVLEHRRPDVEGDATRRSGEICDRRKKNWQEGPRDGSRELRLRLCCARCDG